MRFYKDKGNSDKSTAYMFIEEGIITGIHGEILYKGKLEKSLLLKKQDNYGKNY